MTSSFLGGIQTPLPLVIMSSFSYPPTPFVRVNGEENDPRQNSLHRVAEYYLFSWDALSMFRFDKILEKWKRWPLWSLWRPFVGLKIFEKKWKFWILSVVNLWIVISKVGGKLWRREGYMEQYLSDWNQLHIFDNDNYSIIPKSIFSDNDNLPISCKIAYIGCQWFFR